MFTKIKINICFLKFVPQFFKKVHIFKKCLLSEKMLMNSKPVHTLKKIKQTNVHDFVEKIKKFKKNLSIRKILY